MAKDNTPLSIDQISRGDLERLFDEVIDKLEGGGLGEEAVEMLGEQAGALMTELQRRDGYSFPD